MCVDSAVTSRLASLSQTVSYDCASISAHTPTTQGSQRYDNCSLDRNCVETARNSGERERENGRGRGGMISGSERFAQEFVHRLILLVQSCQNLFHHGVRQRLLRAGAT